MTFKYRYYHPDGREIPACDAKKYVHARRVLVRTHTKETMKKQTQKSLIKKVDSIAELMRLAIGDDRYAALALAAANNLGGSIVHSKGWLRAPSQRAFVLGRCRQWLVTNAREGGGEEGVVEEINFCRDLV